MPNIIILTSKAGKESATKLANCLKAKIENPYETNKNNYESYDIVFKYGVSTPVSTKKNAIVLNKHKATKTAIDKLISHKLFEEEDFSIPYTKDLKVAISWLKTHTVVARTTSTGKNSEGVTFCDTEKELKNAPALYWTKFIPHTNEIRVNVWKNQAISIYDKKEIDMGEEDMRFQFILWNGLENHPQLTHLINTIYNKTNLDWYGIDILRDKKGKLYLLEINSAPILYPTTLKRLVETFNKTFCQT